ncbi:MAG: hypothetical protein JXB88_17370 [Spirochaetales bacterium]|nr:hypothetical protein [Spirochaetales bacterium]
MDEKKIYTEEERKEVKEEFISEMEKRFKKEEAQGISFTLGNFISDVDIGIIIKVDNGEIMSYEGDREKVKECDTYIIAPLDIFNKMSEKDSSLSEIKDGEWQDYNVYFGGDVGLIYEIYNIFDIEL